MASWSMWLWLGIVWLVIGAGRAVGLLGLPGSGWFALCCCGLLWACMGLKSGY